jgi:hypothetical protein
MRMGSGFATKRKDSEGYIIRWKREGRGPRVEMLPTSYIQRESIEATQFSDTVLALEEKQNGVQRFEF